MGEFANPMGISELAKRAGVTARTVRYYISIGLLPAAGGRGKRQTYGYRHLARLLLIQHLKSEYLPLEEIRARIEGLSLREIEELLKAGPDPASEDPEIFLQSVLRERRSRSVGREAAIQCSDSRPERPATFREHLASRAQPDASPDSGVSDQEPWYRVTLDRGLELSYQLSGDDKRDQAIEAIVDFAMNALQQGSARQDPDSGCDPAIGERGPSEMASTRIHLVERDHRFKRLAPDDYESGYWAVAEGEAERLVGGAIYFHERQRDPSYFGGIILGYRTSHGPDFPGRIIFRFRSGPERKGVLAGDGGWRSERKVVIAADPGADADT